ncbi:O-antigen ligase family protein [Halomonas sp. KAO]|uniref:O-antigen ligase family protein n=1 Tax=Halomonas sp. KAO TaxID=2783858 RepID=UPI00189E7B18|nr:O-antigen ligase family protein [Halomonas sp. KAO]MBF7052528.1 O-antigen ligase family protein [Halomonas sp. KAO]
MKIDYKNHSLIKAKLTKEAGIFSAILVIFGLLSAIALPSVSLGGFSAYLVTLLSPAIFLLALLLLIKKPLAHRSCLLPLALFAMVCVSALVSWISGFSSANKRDIIEAIKYLQFFPYLLMVTFLEPNSLKLFHRIIVASSILVALVGLTQASGFYDATLYVYLDANSAHIDSLVSGSRITLTGSDPNIGGVIACFFGIYFFSLYAAYKKYRYMFVFFLFFYLCFLSQSRTALIALIFGMGAYYLLFFKGFFILKSATLAFAFSLVIFLVFYLDLSYIYIGIQTALEGNNNSLNIRFENTFLAIERFMKSPIFGVGPAKSALDTTIDSEYALIIQRYGLIGGLIFSTYIVYLLRLSVRNLRSHWGISLFIFTLMSSLVMITNNIFSGYQLMSLVVLLNIACVLSERKQESLKQENVF